MLFLLLFIFHLSVFIKKYILGSIVYFVLFSCKRNIVVYVKIHSNRFKISRMYRRKMKRRIGKPCWRRLDSARSEICTRYQEEGHVTWCPKVVDYREARSHQSISRRGQPVLWTHSNIRLLLICFTFYVFSCYYVNILFLAKTWYQMPISKVSFPS